MREREGEGGGGPLPGGDNHEAKTALRAAASMSPLQLHGSVRRSSSRPQPHPHRAAAQRPRVCASAPPPREEVGGRGEEAAVGRGEKGRTRWRGGVEAAAGQGGGGGGEEEERT
jgi:hypothetical protein